MMTIHDVVADYSTYSIIVKAKSSHLLHRPDISYDFTNQSLI